MVTPCSNNEDKRYTTSVVSAAFIRDRFNFGCDSDPKSRSHLYAVLGGKAQNGNENHPCIYARAHAFAHVATGVRKRPSFQELIPRLNTIILLILSQSSEKCQII